MEYEIIPLAGVGPVALGASREAVLSCMCMKPESYKKTPMSEYETDTFYSCGFQIFYAGIKPTVESIELSRGSGFDVMFSGLKILELPVTEVLHKVKEITGIPLQTEDGGYSYEIPKLGLWFWRPVISVEEGEYFETIGVGVVNT